MVLVVQDAAGAPAAIIEVGDDMLARDEARIGKASERQTGERARKESIAMDSSTWVYSGIS